jgi:hypothetical protein
MLFLRHPSDRTPKNDKRRTDEREVALGSGSRSVLFLSFFGGPARGVARTASSSPASHRSRIGAGMSDSLDESDNSAMMLAGTTKL